MGQVLHASATTTEATRRAIQNSQESLRTLAKRYGINIKTVAKWKKRTSVADLPTGPKQPRSTVLSIEEEAAIVAFRKHTLLPLDDCLYALQPTIPHLTRSSLHRCLQRHGISRLPEPEGEKPVKKTFKRYPIGYFHIDIAEVHTAEGKLYLFLAIDRTSKFAFAELHGRATKMAAAQFLRNLINAVPYHIHTVLTDNGIQFTNRRRDRYGPAHIFTRVCQEHGIEHRLTQVKHPWTNGQVERMNRTIKEATVKRFHYDDHAQLQQHLASFMNAYNFARRLKTLKGLTPYEFICKQWNDQPERFRINPCQLMAGLNSYSLLYASYAVMLLLLSTGMLYWPFKDDSDASFMVQTVVLSGSCYLVAVLTSFSASFLNKATSSLSRHRRAFDRLKGLNELVLNHVNEAVVVLDVGQRVWLMNRQAQNYFPWLQREQQAPALAWLVQRWQRYPSRAFVTRTEIDGQAVQIRARPLVREDESLLMLFIRSQKDLAAAALSTQLAALGQLTANLAHEIRNPLSAIRQSNGLLSADNDNPLTAKLHGIIDNNIARIDKMLEEVSSLNKSDRLNPEIINLMAFWLAFKNEFLLIRPEAAPCIRFHMESGGSPVKVRFDSAHLQQILWNLLNNAWQHGSQQKGSITVLVKPLQDRHAVSLMVIDDGPGVPAENQAQLFEPFFTTRAEGTGLGLYVARELAHANLGQLDYHPAVKGLELILPRENDE